MKVKNGTDDKNAWPSIFWSDAVTLCDLLCLVSHSEGIFIKRYHKRLRMGEEDAVWHGVELVSRRKMEYAMTANLSRTNTATGTTTAMAKTNSLLVLEINILEK